MEIVNGYMCRDCTDVSYAKKNIDPAHPQEVQTPRADQSEASSFAPSVQWGGALASLNAAQTGEDWAAGSPVVPRLNLLV